MFNGARVPTAGGTWWVVGRDPATKGWAPSVSTDAGRSWRTNVVLPESSSPDYHGWSVTERDRTLYATALTGPAAEGPELLAVL